MVCYFFLLVLFSSQLHCNLALPAIFITQLAHSCFPFSFVVEALTAKVMYRTGRFVARPAAAFTATETRTAAGGRSATAADPARHSPPV